jgi:hypothetical protein
VAGLLLYRVTVVTTSSRSTALRSLALAGVVFSARVATADSINLLRPSSAAAPLILIDQSKGPWRSDDEATGILDRECVAVSGRDREPKRVALGGVNWRAGELAWQWERRAEPEIIYVICVDRAPREGGAGGGMQLAAALSWSDLPLAMAGRGEWFAGIAGAARPDGRRTATTPGQTPDSPWSDPPWTSSDPPPSWESEPPLDPPRDVPIGAPLDLPIPIGSIRFPPTEPIADDVPGTGGEPPPPSRIFDPPIALDPREMVPMPEPGTFLLMGTGLAAAWRMSRRKRED